MQLEINLSKKTQKHSNAWKLNSILLNNECVTKDIKEEIKKKLLETNENEHTTTQNLWDTAKAVITGNFIALQA